MKTILFRLLIAVLRPELVISILKMALELIESAVVSSSTDWDDKTILPIIKRLRGALGQ